MRLLGVLAAALLLAAPAAAATPRFGIYDLQADLAPASHNEFGDVKVWRRPAALRRRAPGAALARCAGDCPFGNGWLAFARPPGLAAGDVAGARAAVVHRLWTVSLRLTPAGARRWRRTAAAAAARARRRGVPDVLAVTLDGTIVGQAFASEVRLSGRSLRLDGFAAADAKRVAARLG